MSHDADVHELELWEVGTLPAPFGHLDRAEADPEEVTEYELAGPSLAQVAVLAASLGVLWAAWRKGRRQ